MMTWLYRLSLVLTVVFCGAAGAGTLRFVTEPFPPYSYPVSATDSTAAGPMAEVVQAVCVRIKASCHAEVYPWRRAYSMVIDGDVDGMFSLMPTKEREADLYFTDLIVGGAYTFFARRTDTLHFSRPSDLDGRSVAVYGPSGTSIALEGIRNQTSARTILEVSNDILLKKLTSGRYGDSPVFLMNRDVAQALMQQYGIQGMKPAGDLMAIAYAVGFSRKRCSPKQVEQFNAGVKALLRDGTIKAILNKYGLSTVPRE